MSLALLRPSAENLPPLSDLGVWSAAQLAAHPGQVVASGYAALDTQLPGGGWPLGSLTELLQTQPGAGEWGLLLPALAATPTPRGVVLVGTPHVPLGAALNARGLEPQRLLWVHTEAPAARAWACEQALRCADVAAVLAWLPQVRADVLRRLHLAAQEHAKLLWVLRPAQAQHEASPAPLRLRLEGGVVHVVKRRGPPLAQPIALPLQAPAVLQLLAVARTRSLQRRSPQTPADQGVLHALDRCATPV